MLRREFIALVGGAASAWPLSAHAQQPRKIPRIGMLWHAGSAEEEAIYLEAFRQGLRDHGYVDGQNIVIENRFPSEIPERFISFAAELATLNIDIFVAVTRLGALAAQRATTTIPIVFIFVPDPVGSKLVASLAHPGGNISGLSNFAHDLAAKRVEYLKAIVPGVSRIGLLVNPNDVDNSRRSIEESQTAADKLGLTLRPVEIRKPGDLAPAFSNMHADRIDGLVMSQDGLFFVARKEIADLALAHRLPLMVFSRETLQAGALAAYGPSVTAIFRRAGAYVDKILKGAKPADIPVEQPTKFEFLVNLPTAITLGLPIPELTLARADEVIE